VNQGPQAPDKTLASGTRKGGEPPPDAMPPVHKSIMLVDLKTGKTVWKNGDFTGLRSKTGSMDRISHVTLAVGNGQAFLFATRFEIVSLDLRNGTEIWRSKRPEFIEHLMRYNVRLTDRATLVYSNGVLLFGYPNQGTGIIGHKKTPAQIVAYSAKDGALLWQRKMAGWGWAEPPDIYVIDNQVWIHDYDTFSLLALEPKTGKEIRRFSTAAGLDIGHHHRCYRNRSTENYIMTSHRGIEFYNVATGEISKNHWVRGACQFGVIPANGMVYSTPHPCECFIDSKLNGFLALSPREAPKAEGNPLIKGEAYGTVPATAETNYAWPTYRYDKARSGGAVPFAVTAALKPLWTAKMPGKATAAVVADNKVLTISQTDHTVYAFDAASGRKLWEYTLDGPSDVPPTLYKGAALCGSKNGWVYCLRAADGKLAWRLRAAPNERKMVAYGRLESAWPVYGVLINNGLACFAAGRSSFLDGGIYTYAADPATGEIKDRKLLFTAKSEYFGVNNGNGCLADVLLAVGNDVYMRNELVFGKETRDRHVYAKSGLLERSWFNRTDWTFGGRDMGQYFILDSQNVYVLKATERSVSSMFSPGSGYLMYAQSIGSKVPAPAIDKPEGEKPAKKKSKEPSDSGVLWKRKVPLRVVAMAKAGDVLFAGGSPDVVNPNDPWGAIEGREGGRLQAISAADGKQLAEYTLGAVPMLDGISLMPGRLFVVLEDGSMVCFGDK
jgi:outer membrane protein assembly factor BamB